MFWEDKTLEKYHVKWNQTNNWVASKVKTKSESLNLKTNATESKDWSEMLLTQIKIQK